MHKESGTYARCIDALIKKTINVSVSSGRCESKTALTGVTPSGPGAFIGLNSEKACITDFFLPPRIIHPCLGCRSRRPICIACHGSQLATCDTWLPFVLQQPVLTCTCSSLLWSGSVGHEPGLLASARLRTVSGLLLVNSLASAHQPLETILQAQQVRSPFLRTAMPDSTSEVAQRC